MPRLKKHNPSIDWTQDTLTFGLSEAFLHSDPPARLDVT
jgi:hypothetical protein